MPSWLGLSIDEAAEELRVSPWLVKKMVREGHLPCIPHTGRRVVISRPALRRFVSQEAGPREVAS